MVAGITARACAQHHASDRLKGHGMPIRGSSSGRPHRSNPEKEKLRRKLIMAHHMDHGIQPQKGCMSFRSTPFAMAALGGLRDTAWPPEGDRPRSWQRHKLEHGNEERMCYGELKGSPVRHKPRVPDGEICLYLCMRNRHLYGANTDNSPSGDPQRQTYCPQAHASQAHDLARSSLVLMSHVNTHERYTCG